MDRRAFVLGLAGAAVAAPAAAAVGSSGEPILRGTLSAAELGLVAEDRDAQSRSLQRLLDAASDDDREVFLPAGTYFVSDLKLPARTRLAGIPGATRLVFAGGSSMMTAERAEIVELRSLVIDGAGAPMEAFVPGLVHLAECSDVVVEDCTIIGSSGAGLAVDRSRGRVARNSVRGARDAGIRTVESRGMSITDNVVENCGNAGIVVQRWEDGEDGTIVTGNRVSQIGALDGGKGENGNGVTVFRAHGVIVSNNRISDCAFSAIRANSANNVQLTGNNCARSGEVGIYSEFAFEGAMIANNIVDGAATGISVVNFSEGGRIAVVSANIVRNLTGTGPYAAEPPGLGTGIVIEADAAVSGNVIDGAPRFGMQIGWGPYLRDVVATGNVVRRAPVGIAVTVVEGAGSAVISDNLISGAEGGAIVGMRWAEAATGDLALTGADGYPHLLIERNRIS